uniref:CSON000736 protein n=1 Tax=Culicoides sonorensis TaxID=179676 RepID=A0A336K4B8_CULSO
MDKSTEQNTINSESTDQVNHKDNNSCNKDKIRDNKASQSSNGKQSSSSSSLGKRRKSTKNKKSHSHQQQINDININYKNLDEWLENSIKGMSVNDQPSSYMPNNGSPIHGMSSAFNHNNTVNNNNPFSQQNQQFFNPNMLPPYMARPWSDMSHQNFANNSMSQFSSDFVSLPPMPLMSNSTNNEINNGNGNKDMSSRSSTNIAPMMSLMTNTPFMRYFNDANSNFMGRQHPVTGPQPSASTPNLLLDHNKSATTNTSDESDDTKESTSLSKASLKLDESSNNNSNNVTKNDLNSLRDNNISSNESNNQLLLSLVKQINLLHETNTKIFHNLQETKVELDALKNMNAPLNWGLRHRRDSISGLSLHSQPIGHLNNGYTGSQSPAPTFHSTGNYQPGVVTDVIREVREGTRVREEALLNKVKNMIEERQWSINETNLRVVRELEELKIQVHQIRLDNKHTDDKVARLESEMTSLRNLMTHSMSFMRPTTASFDNNSQGFTSINPGNVMRRSSDFRSNLNDPKRLSLNFTPMNYSDQDRNEHDNSMVQLERDTLELRRELQDAIANKKASESKILALEKLVTSLKNRVPVNVPVQAEYNNHQQGIAIETHPSTPPQPQKAVTVQTVTPKSILTNTLSLNGPVTDL